MPGASDHLLKVCSNLEFLVDVCDFGSRRKYDWEITVVFYSAVHLLEAKLAEETPSFHSEDHKERRQHLWQLNIRGLYGIYHDLKSASEQARYEPTGLPSTQFSPADVKKSFSKLEKVRKLCRVRADSQLDRAFQMTGQCRALRLK